MSLRRSPAAWHVASLVIGFAVIMVFQRDQWFFFDEWAFLEPDGPGLLEPHVGHWSTSPLALFRALRAVFGLDSYLPFAVAVTVAHLATAHMVWRIALRARANAWIATAAVTVLVFLGSGAENILWGFQVGFLGALALGLLAFHLAAAPVLTGRRLAAIIGVSLFALTWSGTAIPIIVATSALILHRHGAKRAVIYATSCAVVYLAWYVAFAVGNPHNPDTGGLSLEKLFIKIPQFIGVMLLLGWQSIFPLFGIGALMLIALLLWLIRMQRNGTRLPGFSPALMLTGAAALFALMTAYSRAEWSVGSGRSSRYLYMLVVLLLPLCTVALTRLARERLRWVAGMGALLLALAGYQASILGDAAAQQSAREQGSQRLISAALALYVEDPDGVDVTARPDSEWAPDVTLGDLVVLYERGDLPIGDYSSHDVERVREVVASATPDTP
ncbi:hypothetical protein LGT39_01045 [Demequina sp. TTPB684]|uniref:hypothetical protein n=1 Tax=unclassified Demequina TaxID=2620311 RepID=UPI001CF180D2|nr:MULTISPECIES: hypothetical protein [unclassified Demequina]MCB2411432.1 hypothetical protein [Demequina sp. TTPB684]UPU88276.1 hypothetical protein LGT36_013700 [Demequina sp. TMPB413]